MENKGKILERISRRRQLNNQRIKAGLSPVDSQSLLKSIDGTLYDSLLQFIRKSESGYYFTPVEIRNYSESWYQAAASLYTTDAPEGWSDFLDFLLKVQENPENYTDTSLASSLLPYLENFIMETVMVEV